MKPNRFPQLSHSLEQPKEGWLVQRLTVDVREHLDTHRSQFSGGTFRLGQRCFRVVHRQRGDKAQKAIRVKLDHLRLGIIGDPGKISRTRGTVHRLDGWGGDAGDLAVTLEPVHHREAGFEIHHDRDLCGTLQHVQVLT